MIRVVVESPFAPPPPAEGTDAHTWAALYALIHAAYLRAALHDCLMRGEAPFASHAIYTLPGVLRDEDPAEREHGIQAGFAWGAVAERVVVYTDFGISQGMQQGINRALARDLPVEYRTIPAFAQPKE